MTTTLRPQGPERHGSDGARGRSYAVCVNGRPVGRVDLTAGDRFGPGVGHIDGLVVDERDRGRGRGTAAVLAGEEVLRSWGCRLVQVGVPGDAPEALRMAVALGYTEHSRHMEKPLTGGPVTLPAGSTVRPLAPEEYGPWLERGEEEFVEALMEYGLNHEEARSRADAGVAGLLPDSAPAPGTALLALEHEGRTVARLWLRTSEPAWVLQVEVEPGDRGRGHGRAMMLAAEREARAAGADVLGLNVFVSNTTAVRLYASLGYRPVRRHFTKALG